MPASQTHTNRHLVDSNVFIVISGLNRSMRQYTGTRHALAMGYKNEPHVKIDRSKVSYVNGY